MAVRVFSHENITIVHLAKNLLASHGINSIIKNEFHGGGGHVGLSIIPIELWVTDEMELDRAERLLRELENEN